MSNKYTTLSRNMLFFTIGNFSSKFLMFFLVPIYTSVLTTSEYGLYDAIVTSILVLIPIATANISDAVMRFLISNKFDKKEILIVGYKYAGIGILICAIFCILNKIFVFVEFFDNFEIYAFAFASVMLMQEFCTQYAQALNRVSVIAICGVLGTVTVLSANILLLIVFNYGIKGFFIANILGIAIPLLVYVYMLKPFAGFKISDIFKIFSISKEQHIAKLEKDMLAFSVPLIFTAVGWIVNSSLDKYCVIYFLGVQVSGLIAVAYKIPTILSTVYALFTKAWQISALLEYEKAGYKEFYTKTFIYVNAIGSICMAVLLLLNKQISGFLYAKDFYVAWQFVPFLLIGALFNNTAGFFGPLLNAKNNSKAMAKSAIYGTIVNFLFNITLIPLLGAVGAVIATGLGSFVIFITRWCYARELINPQGYTKVIISWLLLLVAAILAYYDINYTFQLSVAFMLLLVNIKEMMTLSNKIFAKMLSSLGKVKKIFHI